MMSAAAQREDRCLTALATMKGAVLGKVSEKLIKVGFVREIVAKAEMPVWRRDEVGKGLALKLSAAGLKAIAVGDDSERTIEQMEPSRPKPTSKETTGSGPGNIGEHADSIAPPSGNKLALVISLLRRSDGTTLANLTEATGWLPHPTRAALTGLRKRG